MKRRIVICLALLLALCLIGDAIALVCLDRSIGQLSSLAESHRIQSMRSALSSGGLRVERDALEHLVGHEKTPEERNESIWRFKDSLFQCGSCHHAPGVTERLGEIGRIFDRWLDESDAFFARGREARIDPEEGQALELVDRVAVMTGRMADQARRHLRAKSSDARRSVHNAWLALCATLVAALLFGGLVAVHLQRRLTRPVSALLAGIERSRNGDLDHEFAISADEEFRILGEAFNKAYRDMRAAQDCVLQAEKMAAVGKIAAGVAHEVGNPLASISSIAQMMQRRCRSEEDRQALDLIMDHIRRISGIVRDMLDFSRPTDGRIEDVVDVGALVARATELLRFDKRSRGVRVRYGHEPTPMRVRASSDRLLVVFTNIVLNAFDALGEGGREEGDGVLDISCRGRGRTVVVTFEDNGPGMTEQEVRVAFEPFFTTKQPGAGTGLGLWICYKTVRRYGGSIRIESRPGRGTRVIVELPMAGDAEHASTAANCF